MPHYSELQTNGDRRDYNWGMMPEPALTCGSKTICGQMSSCDEAKFYLTRCGVKRLDGDGDGVPCASLCQR